MSKRDVTLTHLFLSNELTILAKILHGLEEYVLNPSLFKFSSLSLWKNNHGEPVVYNFSEGVQWDDQKKKNIS